MSTTTIFIFGIAIFSSYMFFLLRMISKQHKLEQEKHPVLRVERSNDKSDENKQAS
ncbi:MAG: hypothetical protein P8P74_08180 [Crocinitomicaceae bacterium]|nr:hypothetical protein [Crocinitomicaceae bacterium]